MDAIKQAIHKVLAETHPATVRQTFYQLVSRGAIAKTETEYKSTVVRLLTAVRRSGEIPFGWIADNTRWMRKPSSYSSLSDMLHQSQRFYRRALWDDQDAYVEIWLEKDALSGVLYDVTAEFDVPLMVTRGYPSISYLYEAAEAIAETGKPAFLYYFGDYDPCRGAGEPRVRGRARGRRNAVFASSPSAPAPPKLSSPQAAHAGRAVSGTPDRLAAERGLPVAARCGVNVQRQPAVGTTRVKSASDEVQIPNCGARAQFCSVERLPVHVELNLGQGQNFPTGDCAASRTVTAASSSTRKPRDALFKVMLDTRLTYAP